MGKPLRIVNGSTATPEVAYVSCKRTLMHSKHSHRYPHHYQHHPPDGRINRSSSSISNSSSTSTTIFYSSLSKFLILLFLSICDNRAGRKLTLAEAAAAAVVVSSSTSSSPSFSSVFHSQVNVVAAPSDSESDDATAAPFNRTKLQEIVLEGLGLDAVPDVRAVSRFCCLFFTSFNCFLSEIWLESTPRRYIWMGIKLFASGVR